MRVSGILAQQAEAGEVYAHGQHGLCREHKRQLGFTVGLEGYSCKSESIATISYTVVVT